MRTMLRPVLLVALVLFGCDTAKRSEVEGLQQRLDGVAAEQAELRKKLDESGEATRTAAETRAKVEAELATVKSELAALSERVKTLESTPKPTLPAHPTAAGRPDPAERYSVKVDDAFANGSADARVTVVIFSDFQCPFCARVQATLKELQGDYKGDVRLVAKHNPLPMHANAMPAALAAEAAGKQGKFWEMHDKLYENGKALAAPDIEGYAKDLGLDLKRFRTDMAAADVKARVEAHAKEAAELGARGTPAFFINGRFLSGAQPLASFKTLVDEELRKADELIARGVPKSGVYDELMATAKPGAGKTARP